MQKLYTADWESIDSRPIPDWFDEAKFGIFIHWGVYSVPSWAPKSEYAEWYWHQLVNQKPATVAFHEATYGKDFRYQDFAPMLRAELFDPARWAELFRRSGAKYVALTSKHHDGFCLWPSEHSWNWNSVDIGSHRDLCGDLTQAVRAAGLKMGFYYSLYEWYHPWYLNDVNRYVGEHMLPQFKDLVKRYEPSLLFTDGEWDQTWETWRSPEFLSWLFNETACREEVVVCDRWGTKLRGVHGGYYTTEYGDVDGVEPGEQFDTHKWEECRGIGRSFGYNRNEDAEDYATAEELIELLVSTVSKGGNLLLNVGPTADGRIPGVQQERLLQMGTWLDTYGEAIYGTKRWRETGEGESIFYTQKEDAVYAIILELSKAELVLQMPKPTGNTAIEFIGREEKVSWSQENNGLRIQLPPNRAIKAGEPGAYVLKMTGVE